ncbi:hypothetical protein HYU06_05680 [Candidatus Woesearchaeota archaeon]|nr:hypothetical protein [Candidatus Woesearchaeota archaeon]
MRELENYLTLTNLENSKNHLVPYIFTKNYFNILKKNIIGKRLTETERYYYTHFIKKKLFGMIGLLGLDMPINRNGPINKIRINKAIRTLNKYSRKHKNMKILISGSFLYSKKYNDIDIFIISKYNKEDYREGKVHINYLPQNIEKTLFFQSIYAISISNFKSNAAIEDDFNISDILHIYETVVLLIMQKDIYLQELRELVINLEYASNRVILNSMQLKIITDKIAKSKNPILVINKYLIAKIINAFDRAVLRKTLTKFIQKNSSPEKGQKIYENWAIYNQTYKEAIEVVA